MSQKAFTVSKPQNSIMQLVEQFKNDKHINKMNLTVGVYMDQYGNCPILKSVKEAEEHCLEIEKSKVTFNMIGAKSYHEAVKQLLFPNFSKAEKENIQVIQTVGSCGALYLVGQLINKIKPTASLWLSNPTWENHRPLLESHVSEICEYRYEPLDKENLCVQKIMEDLQYSKAGDFVLFHACCHNPTGMDPTINQWQELAKFCKNHELIPIFDFAYQGFKDTIQSDAEVLNIFREEVNSFIVCNSFSKNMGLYDERVGALTFVFDNQEEVDCWLQCAKSLIRSSYSTPPIHGSSVVSCIINDSERFQLWQAEVDNMRKGLIQRRTEFFQKLDDVGMKERILNYENQNGMFACLNISLEQIEYLRNSQGIYILNSGRISIASLNSQKISKFCEAICNI